MRSTTVLLSVLLLLSAASGASVVCKKKLKNTNFDLNSLQLQEEGAAYTVLDKRTLAESSIHRQYYFNLCKDVYVPSAHKQCDATRIEGGYSGFEDHTGPAGAFVYDHIGNTCHRLGGSVALDSGFGWSLIDDSDDARGVQLSYSHGDEYCMKPGSDNTCEQQTWYHFNLILACTTVPTKVPTEHIVTAVANNHSMTLSLVAGCPSDCPIVGEKLCSGHGVCGYDYDNNFSHCFCDTGYSGDSCNKKTKNLTSPALIAIIIIAILVVAITGMVLYICLKLRKININPEAYDSLERKFNELGQLAA